MKISQNSAQQIVEEIGKLVKQNINLMDETGHIVASNDPARIGNFHTGAYRIIQNRLKEFYITPELEREMPNVRRGINLPIEVDGEVQGVIGITGDATYLEPNAPAIGGTEMVYFAQAIGGKTYEYMFPLLGIAVIYLVLVMILSWLQGKMERRLRQSDRR